MQIKHDTVRVMKGEEGVHRIFATQVGPDRYQIEINGFYTADEVEEICDGLMAVREPVPAEVKGGGGGANPNNAPIEEPPLVDPVVLEEPPVV